MAGASEMRENSTRFMLSITALALWVAWLPMASPALGQEHLSKGWAHGSTVLALAFSPDGSVLASTDANTVKLWEVATGRLLHKLPDSSGAVSLAFSPDSSRLAVGGSGIRCWEVASGRLIQKLNDTTNCEVAFGEDGDTLFSGPGGLRIGALIRWDLRQGTGQPPADGAGNLTREQWSISPGGRWVAFTPDGQQIILYDSRTSSVVDRLARLPSPLEGVKFGNASTLLAWAPGRVSLYSPESRSFPLQARIQGKVKNIELSPDGKLVAVDQAGKVLLVTVPEARTTAVHNYATDGNLLQQMVLTADGLLTLVVNVDQSDCSLRLVDTSSGASLARAHSMPIASRWSINTVAVSPDSQLLATGHFDQNFHGASRPVVCLWDLERTRRAGRFPRPPAPPAPFEGQRGETLQVVFSRYLPGHSCAQGEIDGGGSGMTSYRLLVDGEPSNLSALRVLSTQRWIIENGSAGFLPYQFRATRESRK